MIIFVLLSIETFQCNKPFNRPSKSERGFYLPFTDKEIESPKFNQFAPSDSRSRAGPKALS